MINDKVSKLVNLVNIPITDIGNGIKYYVSNSNVVIFLDGDTVYNIQSNSSTKIHSIPIELAPPMTLNFLVKENAANSAGVTVAGVSPNGDITLNGYMISGNRHISGTIVYPLQSN